MSNRTSSTSADQLSGDVLCYCEVCNKTRDSALCLTESYAKQHVTKVVDLIKKSQTTTLVVGPSQVEINCHTILLSYFSTFFDESLYGDSKLVRQKSLSLPDFDAEEISAFTSWLYSGRVNRKCWPEINDAASRACSSWILGNKLGAPSFSNQVMRFLCDFYNEFSIEIPETELVYKQTAVGSKLRLFIAQLIRHEGPFCPKIVSCFIDKKEHMDKWKELVSKGGDFVLDVIAGGLSNYDPSHSPWQNHISKDYNQSLLQRATAKSWHDDKVLVDRARREVFKEEKRAVKGGGDDMERGVLKNQKRSPTEATDPTALANAKEEASPDRKRARNAGDGLVIITCDVGRLDSSSLSP